jgi:hypothetical protein
LLTTTQIKNASFSGYDRYSYVSANAFYSSGAWKYITSDTAAQYTQNVSSGGHQWSSAASGTAGNNITFTQVLNVAKGATLALEGATSATGTGIAFPATQSASSDANTLDDYEEGTWTATLTGSSGSATYSTQAGTYTKIGNYVYVQAYVALTAIGTLTGSLSISGLPFTSNTSGNTYNVINARFNTTAALSSPSSGIGYAQINPASTSGGLQFGLANGITVVTQSLLTNNTDIIFSGSYRTNS